MSSPKYKGLEPASAKSSAAARAASRKVDTKPEMLLRRALWHKGLRFRKNAADLPGMPDIVFRRAGIVVFVDGDFWHGKDWEARRSKLKQGHNAHYWLEKISRNRERDVERTRQLELAGWVVRRYWESDIRTDLNGIVNEIELLVCLRRGTRK